MKKYDVTYQAGESRMHPEKSIDFMLANVPVGEDNVELYAEMENPTWDEDTERFNDEIATYGELKAEILSQAAKNGIPSDSLVFQFDQR